MILTQVTFCSQSSKIKVHILIVTHVMPVRVLTYSPVYLESKENISDNSRKDSLDVYSFK